MGTQIICYPMQTLTQPEFGTCKTMYMSEAPLVLLFQGAGAWWRLLTSTATANLITCFTIPTRTKQRCGILTTNVLIGHAFGPTLPVAGA